MATQTPAEYLAWVRGLQPGDRVMYIYFNKRLFINVKEVHALGGRIVTDNGNSFRDDGQPWNYDKNISALMPATIDDERWWGIHFESDDEALHHAFDLSQLHMEDWQSLPAETLKTMWLALHAAGDKRRGPPGAV